MTSNEEAASLATFYKARFTGLSFVLFLALAALLVLVAGLRHGDGIPDLAGYQSWYSEGFVIKEYLANPALIFQKDPGYYLLSSFFYSHGFAFQTFILFMAMLGVGWKMKGIGTLSNSPFYSALVYISFYFLMHEMVQIRAGAASGLFLLGVPYLVQRRRLLFCLMVLLASCFHYSGLVLLPLALLPHEGRRPKFYLYALLASFALALAGFSLNFLILHLPGNDANTRVAYYLLESQNDPAALKLFTRLTIPNLILAVTLLLNFDKLKTVTPYASHVIRIFCLSQILFYLLSSSMVYAVRLSDLMGVVSILAWPLLFHLVRPAWLRGLLAAVICLNFFTSTLRMFSPSSVVQRQPG